MLPNRMQLNKTVEEQLKRLKSQTGITPNVASRLAFFRSIELGFTCNLDDDYKLDGSLVLDKYTWLGKTQLTTELLLKKIYPNIQNKEANILWARHVEHGISSIRNQKSLLDLVEALNG